MPKNTFLFFCSCTKSGIEKCWDRSLQKTAIIERRFAQIDCRFWSSSNHQFWVTFNKTILSCWYVFAHPLRVLRCCRRYFCGYYIIDITLLRVQSVILIKSPKIIDGQETTHGKHREKLWKVLHQQKILSFLFFFFWRKKILRLVDHEFIILSYKRKHSQL